MGRMTNFLVAPVAKPLLRPLRSAIGYATNTIASAVRALFSSGQQGAWYDPSDMDTAKLTFRRNLLTYSEDFSNAAWTKTNVTLSSGVSAPDSTPTAFSITATAASANIVQVRIDAGTSVVGINSFWVKRLTGTGSVLIYQPISNATDITTSLVGGGWVQVVSLATVPNANTNSYAGIVISTSGDSVAIWHPQREVGTTATPYQKITDYNTEFLAAFPTHTLYQDSAGATPVTAVEQPVGRMLDKSGRGNHVIQATAASRPVLSTRVNLAPVSEPTIAQVTASNVTNSTMTGFASAIAFGTNGVTRYALPVFTPIASTTYTLSVFVEMTDGTAPVPGGLSVGFDFALTVANAQIASGYTVTLVSGSRYRVSVSGISSATPASFHVGLYKDTPHSTKTFVVSGFHIELGPVLTRYQSVVNASTYDTAGFPMYGKSDGVDDSMSSATGGAGTAGFFFCQAIKPTGGAGAVRTLLSDSGTNSGYRVQLNASNQLSFSAGNGTAYTTAATATATTIGTTHLLTAWDDGTNLNVQLDSGTVATIARPVVAAGTSGYTLGKDNNASTGFFAGNLYPEIYRQGSGLTAAERAQVQAYVRSKASL